MPNLRCALTARSWVPGNPAQPLLHPCVRPHFAMNLRTRATLHHYHLDGDEVNADSERMRGEEGMVALGSRLSHGEPSAAREVCTNSCTRARHSALWMGKALAAR
jgi:hypothetical protein